MKEDDSDQELCSLLLLLLLLLLSPFRQPTKADDEPGKHINFDLTVDSESRNDLLLAPTGAL